MAVALVGRSTIATATAGSVTASVTARSGTLNRAAGNCLVCVVNAIAATSAGAITQSGGSDWTKVAGEGNSTYTRTAVFWKIATGSDGGPTFISTLTGSYPSMQCVMYELSGTDLIAPVVTYGSGNAAGNITPLNTLANVPNSSCYAVGGHAVYTGSNATDAWTKSANWTADTTDAATARFHHAWDIYSAPPSGAVLSFLGTWATAGTGQSAVEVVIAPPYNARPAPAVLAAPAAFPAPAVSTSVTVSPTALAAPAAFPGGAVFIPATLANSLDNGTDQAVITTGNSGTSGDAFDTALAGTGATLIYDTALAAHGAKSAKIATGGTAAVSNFSYSTKLTTFGQIWFRVYAYFTAVQTVNNRLITVNSGGSNCGYVHVAATSGKLTILDSANAVMAQISVSIPTGAWFRVEGYLDCSPTAGQGEIRLFTGANVDGSTPDQSATSTAAWNTLASGTQCRFGQASSLANVGPFWLDEPAASTVDYLGPVSSGDTTATPLVLACPAAFPAPVVQQDAQPAPAVLPAPATLPAAVVRQDAWPSPVALPAPASFPAVVVSGGATASPAVLAAPGSFPAAAAHGSATAAPVVLPAPAAFPAPAVHGNATVAAVVLPAPATLPAPAVRQDAWPSPVVLPAPAALPLPTATATANAQATPSALAAPAAFPAAVVSGSAAAAPAVLPAPASFPPGAAHGSATTAPAVLPAPAAFPGVSVGRPAGFVYTVGRALYLDGAPYRPLGYNLWRAANTSWNHPPVTTYYLNDGTALADSLANIHATGPAINAIRAWFFQQFTVDQGNGYVRRWDALDKVLSVCAAAGVKVIATLQNQYDDEATGNKDPTWYTSGYSGTIVSPYEIVTYRDWCLEIATRYAGNPTILMWELMNEPNYSGGGSCPGDAAAGLQAWAADVSGAIKSVDPWHLICVGQGGWGQCGFRTEAESRALNAISTIDVISFHDYITSQPGYTLPNPGSLAVPASNGLDTRSEVTGAAVNKPVIVGESGMDLADCGGSAAVRANYLDQKLAYVFGTYTGVAGHLEWQYDNRGQGGDDKNIPPGDPGIAVLSSYALGGAHVFPATLACPAAFPAPVVGTGATAAPAVLAAAANFPAPAVITEAPESRVNSLAGPDETAVTPANSAGYGDAFTAVNVTGDGEVTYDTAQGGGARVSTSVSGGTGNVYWLLPAAAATLYGRFYFYCSAAPAALRDLARFDGPAGACASVKQNPSLQLRLQNSAWANMATQPPAALSLNTWYRVEWRVRGDATTGEAEVRIYLGDAGTPITNGTALNTGVNTRQAADRSYLGSYTAASVSYGPVWFRDYAVSNTGWVGPAAGSALATPAVLAAPASFPAGVVRQDATAAPAVLAAPAAFPAPVIRQDAWPAPTVLAAPAALPLPSVAAGGGVTISAAVLPAPVALPAPVVRQDQTVTPARLAAPAAFPAPAVSGSAAASPAVLAAPASFPAPAVEQDAWPAPARLAAPAAFPAPAVSGAATATPAVVPAPAAFPVPVVRQDQAVTPAVLAAPVALPLPSVAAGGGVTINATVLPAPVALPAPVVRQDASPSPAVLAAPASFPAPVVSGSSAAAPAALPAPASFPPASASGSTVTSPAKLSCPASFPLAGVSGSAAGTPAVLAAPAGFPAPVVRQDRLITVTVLAAPATFPAAAAGGGAGTTPVVLTVTATFPAPAAHTGLTVFPTALTVAVVFPAAHVAKQVTFGHVHGGTGTLARAHTGTGALARAHAGGGHLAHMTGGSQ